MAVVRRSDAADFLLGAPIGEADREKIAPRQRRPAAWPMVTARAARRPARGGGCKARVWWVAAPARKRQREPAHQFIPLGLGSAEGLPHPRV